MFFPTSLPSCTIFYTGSFLLLPKDVGTRSRSLEQRACDRRQSNAIPDLALGHRGDAPSARFSWDASPRKAAPMGRSHQPSEGEDLPQISAPSHGITLGSRAAPPESAQSTDPWSLPSPLRTQTCHHTARFPFFFCRLGSGQLVRRCQRRRTRAGERG